MVLEKVGVHASHFLGTFRRAACEVFTYLNVGAEQGLEAVLRCAEHIVEFTDVLGVHLRQAFLYKATLIGKVLVKRALGDATGLGHHVHCHGSGPHVLQ